MKDKKILLILRSNYTKSFPHYWACAGGRGKEGEEKPEEVVVREIKEELNLNFKPTKLFSTGQYKDRKLFRFIGEWEGNIKIQEEEIVKFGWFSFEEAVKLKLAFDYKKVIEKLHNKKLI